MYTKIFIKSSLFILLMIAFNTANAALPDPVNCYTHHVFLGSTYDFADNPYDSCSEIFAAHIAASPGGIHTVSGGHSIRGLNNAGNISQFNKAGHVIDPTCFDGHNYYE